jgi:hypothetical protein
MAACDHVRGVFLLIDLFLFIFIYFYLFVLIYSQLNTIDGLYVN